MKRVAIGKLPIGRIPRVVGVLGKFESLAGFGRTGHKACDIAEVRLDLIGTDSDWLNQCRSIERSGTPVLLTLRSTIEGGKSALDNEQRTAILETALPVVSAVDVELSSGLAEGPLADQAGRKRKPLLISYHDFEKTAPVDQLSDIVLQAQKLGSIVKVSTFIQAPSDVKILEALLQKKWEKPLCVIGMGPLGSTTRITFACAGSCLTYGYIDSPVAPGQLSAQTLVEQLRRMIPAFDEDFIERGGVRT